VSKAFIFFAGCGVISACAAGTTGGSASTPPSAQAPRVIRDIRDLAIIPSTKTVCPGQPIQARYEAILGDGSRVKLAPNELSRFALRGIAALPAPDGSWITSGNPLESAATGFRLSVSLATDPGVHADTVIVPSYNCQRLSFGLTGSDRFTDAKAQVRLGVFASPFYDSIVVAAIERDASLPIVVIVDPSHMRARSLQVSAVGKPGASGTPGNSGNGGGQCEDGSNGTDGYPGESGERGGQIDLVIEAESPWLESLVAVSNSGGRGGAGGRGGLGGRAGPRTNEPGCHPTPGRSGRAGNPGANGSPGPYPTTAKVERSLLWRGSPVWFDSTSRTNLERLMQLETRRR
jgi:hypothetical protein